MNTALGILAVLLLTLGTGYFVTCEFAYISADRVELSRQAAAGDRRAATALRVMRRLSFMLSAAQVGITVTALIVGAIAEPALAQAVRPVLAATGLPDAVVPGIALALGFAIATVVQMVLGELVPKNLALARAEPLAKRLAPSVLVYLAVAGPVVRLFDESANWLLRKVGIEPVEELHHGATLEELGHIIGESRESTEHGTLSDGLSALLERALSFTLRTAGEVMVPRPDVVPVPASGTPDQLIEIVAEHGHSHYPVLGEGTDEVVGVAGVRELMCIPAGATTGLTLATVARPALLVPDTIQLPSLVEQMQEQREEFAVVLDEYGGLAGIVTFEDIAEELVGEISDENDEDVVVATKEAGWWQVDAGRRVDEVASHTGLRLPGSDDYETVAGLIVTTLGRFAEPGDRLVVADGSADAVEIEVLSVGRHVPDQVRLRSQAGPGLAR
ncbi:MAG TPA: hemolysin family protein [Jiangellaceae bacterium]|nr:hemolysin family protein [Jiangellaceae bacterium]